MYSIITRIQKVTGAIQNNNTSSNSAQCKGAIKNVFYYVSYSCYALKEF